MSKLVSFVRFESLTVVLLIFHSTAVHSVVCLILNVKALWFLMQWELLAKWHNISLQETSIFRSKLLSIVSMWVSHSSDSWDSCLLVAWYVVVSTAAEPIVSFWNWKRSAALNVEVRGSFQTFVCTPTELHDVTVQVTVIPVWVYFKEVLVKWFGMSILAIHCDGVGSDWWSSKYAFLISCVFFNFF
jgi:hypothetical protein